MGMTFLDTETCGFHGMPVLLQYAFDDSEIELYSIWQHPVAETLQLLDEIAATDVVGFNLAFDWFHLCKLYNVWFNLPPDFYPEDDIGLVAKVEHDSRDAICFKPKRACDLMLHARKGPYQSLMDRKDIRIRKIPAALAHDVARHLSETVKIDDIYFARRKDKFAPKWKVYETRDEDFRDVVLKFSASGSLKTLAIHALGHDENEILTYGDVGVEKQFIPVEVGWAPTAKAAAEVRKRTKSWKSRFIWPECIQRHIDYWAYNPLGRIYAEKDVVYTRGLYRHFNSPPPGDTDSELACMVGAVRWRGFAIDRDRIEKQRKDADELSKSAPKDPRIVRNYLYEVMSPVERLGMVDQHGKPTTKKVILESISKWNTDGTEADKELGSHPAAMRATQVLQARRAKKEVELYVKLQIAGRLHASFIVIGTLSSRMAGADGLNPQGINRRKQVRECFPLADAGYDLCGGDFDAFEVVLADAVYDDPKLRADLQTGKKIHALFAMELFPGKTYEDILATKGTTNDLYVLGKNGVFSQIYGGDENTIKNKLGVALEIALSAMNKFQDRYPGIRKSRKRIYDLFCSMRQPDGIGGRVIWNEPADYVESFLGFRRYFTLENQICKALFELGQKPPKAWKQVKLKVIRREREQTVAGATMSALYGAAFQIQAANMRAAANHEIQNPGALITKSVQRAVWDVQPAGAGEWRVIPMNVHDELLAPTKPQYADQVKSAVMNAVESFRPRVPLIRMDWATKMKSWASKG